MRPLWGSVPEEAPEETGAVFRVPGKPSGADDTTAFEDTYARCRHENDTVEIPPARAPWIVSRNALAALGTPGASGGRTRSRGVVQYKAQQALPSQHIYRGTGRRTGGYGMGTQGGASAQAHSDFPSGEALFRLGLGTNEIAHGVQLRQLHAACAPGVDAWLAEGDGLQEMSTLHELICQGFAGGLNLRYGDAGSVPGRNANHLVHDCELYLRADAPYPAVDYYGTTAVAFLRLTASAYGTRSAFAAPMFRFAGTDIEARWLHAEFTAACVELGHEVRDAAGALASVTSEGIELAHLTVTNPDTFGGLPVDACPRVLWVRDTATNPVTSYEAAHLRQYRASAILEDEGCAATGRPALTLAAATWPYLRRHAVEKTYAGAATAGRIVSSAHEGVRNITLNADLAALDLSFARRIRVTSLGGANRSIHSALGGYEGRTVWIEHQDPDAGAWSLTLPNNSGTGTAGARFRRPNAGGDVVLAYGDVARLDFGMGHAAGAGGWFTRLDH